MLARVAGDVPMVFMILVTSDIIPGKEQRVVPLIFACGEFMEMHGIPFGVTKWEEVETTVHPGETGQAVWRTQYFGDIRTRTVEYTAGYLADHWCTKGHILYCLEGELHTELEDGRTFLLKPGMSYQVADHAEPHRSSTTTGAKLFIVD